MNIQELEKTLKADLKENKEQLHKARPNTAAWHRHNGVCAYIEFLLMVIEK